MPKLDDCLPVSAFRSACLSLVLALLPGVALAEPASEREAGRYVNDQDLFALCVS